MAARKPCASTRASRKSATLKGIDAGQVREQLLAGIDDDLRYMAPCTFEATQPAPRCAHVRARLSQACRGARAVRGAGGRQATKAERETGRAGRASFHEPAAGAAAAAPASGGGRARPRAARPKVRRLAVLVVEQSERPQSSFKAVSPLAASHSRGANTQKPPGGTNTGRSPLSRESKRSSGSAAW